MSDSNNSTTNNNSVSLLHLCVRKHKSRLGADLNESVATGPNAFARAQLEKLGWKEGTGLGKNRDGRSEHIRVTKRRDGQAIGAASTEIDPVVTGDQWWKSSVGNTLAKLAANKKDKKKKKKKKESSEKESKKSGSKKRKLEYTDEELFEATGGARFGMRAQTQQRGKWNRAEEAITKDEEEEALQKTEWDGMAAPKILLSSDGAATKPKKKSKPTPESTIQEGIGDETTILPERKKQKLAAEATKTESGAKGKKKDRAKKEKKKSKKSKRKSKGSDE